ncbi:MAG TPA: SMP-30/gluconolactonase/LRE family protein [Gemmataceae bacterium]|jgi:gluconolactonase|nr:SMP-30/gluconolactonase/LRE family protein [Gemmataceae bacterium]
MTRLVLTATVLAAAGWATPVRGDAPPVRDLPSGKPAAVLDLATRAGVEAVGGPWKYRDATLVEVPFRSPGPDNKPSGPPKRTLEIAPAAGRPGYDDTDWEAIDPGSLPKRRGNGKVSFGWYRINLTIPPRVGDFDTTNSTVVFEVELDDYAEVWVDGELPRVAGQCGGSVVRGFNAPNRLIVARDTKPGRKVQLAVFGINGPISAAPINFIYVRRAKLEFYPREEPAVTPTVVRKHPRLDHLVPPDVKIERIAAGYNWVEGPVWDRKAGALLFSDIPANTVYRWDPKAGTRVHLRPSGYTDPVPFAGREPGSNGLALDPAGRLVLCQHGDRGIATPIGEGYFHTLAARYDGKRLNSPNDLVFHSSGDLYFTDPPFGLPGAFADPARDVPFCGVYRLSPAGKLTLLTKELSAPNGLAFSPDEKTLYVSNADARRAAWTAYPVKADGTLGDGRVFFDATEWAKTRKGDPDGLKADAGGNLFAAGPGGLHVFTPDGTHLGLIDFGAVVSNCAWGEDGTVLYVTAGTTVYRMKLTTKGAGWPRN